LKVEEAEVNTALGLQSVSATTISANGTISAASNCTSGGGSPVTPKAKKVQTFASLPISSIFNCDDDSRSGLRLEAAASPNTAHLELELGFRSSEKRSRLLPLDEGVPSGMGMVGTPTGGLSWDHIGLLSTPKSDSKLALAGNISLPTPPGSALKPPCVLDLPSIIPTLQQE
jgi:hypothetical protein